MREGGLFGPGAADLHLNFPGERTVLTAWSLVSPAPSNLGKFIGPAGLAVIIGASNYVSPKAALAGIVPAFN